MNVTTSDPGSSGVLTAHCETDGLYFDSSKEHEDGIFDLEKEIALYNERMKDVNKITLDYMSTCENVDQQLEREQKLLDVKNSIVFTKKENEVEFDEA